MSNDEHHNLEFLGQKISYPQSLPAVLGVTVIAAAVVCIFYIALVIGKKENIKAVGAMISKKEYSAEGTLEDSSSVKLVQFWTPSSKTKDYLRGKNGKLDDVQKWEDITEEKVKEFGDVLRGLDYVTGYRRYETLGQGRTSFKAGWWWIVTVNPKFDVPNFSKEYAKFWGSKKSLYIEVYTDVSTSH